nr:hypothetical protein [uncultured Roseococcus sp.]
MPQEEEALAERYVVWEALGNLLVRNVLEDRDGQLGKTVAAHAASPERAVEMAAHANAAEAKLRMWKESAGKVAAPATYPALDLPPTTTDLERLAERILGMPGLTPDDLLVTADAVAEAIREAPSNADLRRLRHFEARLRLRAKACGVPGQLQAAALLRVCPVTAGSVGMLRAALPSSCRAWGWLPLLNAIEAAAAAQERGA